MWRPYEDEPLFIPQMLLGFDALESADADRLTRYLAALVARRGAVHAIVAFNAIYLGYDLSFGGYVGGPVDFDQFEQVTFGETTAALPVGAMVNVATGADPLFAEVIYKEGAHSALRDDGDLPGWLSGAPAGAQGPDAPPEPQTSPTLTERLVVDFDAFGSALLSPPQRSWTGCVDAADGSTPMGTCCLRRGMRAPRTPKSPTPSSTRGTCSPAAVSSCSPDRCRCC